MTKSEPSQIQVWERGRKTLPFQNGVWEGGGKDFFLES